MFVVTRQKENPLLAPDSLSAFESYAVFNPSLVTTKSHTVMLYRAQDTPQSFDGGTFSFSTIGRAESVDGISFKKRTQFLAPTEEWERYGCEDPRVVKVGTEYLIFYTALSVFPFRAEGIRIAVARSKDLKTIYQKHLVTPFNAKAMSLFPEKIGGQYVALLSVDSDNPPSHICLARFKKIEDMWDPVYWKKWYAEKHKHELIIPKKDSEQIEVGAAPIKTKDGWLLVYSHIQQYFSDQKIFGIEAVLLDLKDPQKVIGRTKTPLLVPEESYEQYGTVSRTIFPTGTLVEGDDLYIYYGSTDTTISRARVSLSRLLQTLVKTKGKNKKSCGFVRASQKPILAPLPLHAWESRAVFNPTAIDLGGKIHILYRAMSDDNTSTVGYAESADGVHIDMRSSEPLYVPRASFELKRVPGGNSGCEDPRLVQMGNTLYMYYTAYDGINVPGVAMTSISTADFLLKKWDKWSLPVRVSADGVDDKDACVHPEKVNGHYLLFHRVNHMICVDYGSTPAFEERNRFKNIPLLKARPGMWDSKKVGLSVPPLKTKQGWILLYHGISDDGTYRVGALLLDLKDPTIIISRTTDFIFEPEMDYERVGQIGHVVFPCGAVIRHDTLFMYYGGADSVVNVATISVKELLGVLDAE